MIELRRRYALESGYVIPNEYLELKGLQCAVGESYVRTNINLSANTIFEIEFVIQKKTECARCSLFIFANWDILWQSWIH